MAKRIYGLETEYGLLVKNSDFRLDSIEVASTIKNHIFSTGLGVLDQHYRANDEPPRNGGFLRNGGRLYLDMGHLEYASPECATLVDLIIYDRAGDRIVQEAVRDLGLVDQVSIIKNNVDLETNATFGCHENFLVSRAFPFDERENLKLLAAFLVTRQIFCGAGRIGACNPHPFRDWEGISGHDRLDEEVDFQLSQRADHIPNEFYRWVQYNRAIVNTRDEPLSDPSKYRRIHLLVGDTNMNEFTTALKMGTTYLMLDLMMLGVTKREWILADSVGAMRTISRDPEFKWEVTLANGRPTTALDLQWDIMQTAKKYLKGTDQETDWILEEWESVLSDLTRGPEAVMDRVDWAGKFWMLEEFRKEENLAWNDSWLKSQDLEYHNLNRDHGLYWALEENGEVRRKTSDVAIEYSKTRPPRGTRAHGRGTLIQILMEQQTHYIIDWIGFRLNKEEPFLMLDPFVSYKNEIEAYLKEMDLRPESPKASSGRPDSAGYPSRRDSDSEDPDAAPPKIPGRKPRLD